MSGDKPADVVFHLRFQAEILDQVARISATKDDRQKASVRATELRARARLVDPILLSEETRKFG